MQRIFNFIPKLYHASQLQSLRLITTTSFVQNKPLPKTELKPTHSSSNLPHTEVKEKVKESVKTAGYSLVIIGGLIMTGGIFLVVLRELFSQESPNGVYKRALKRCLQDGRVEATLGENIKAFGETDRRGRSRHVANETWFDKDGKRHMAVKFHMKGSTNKATVWVEMREGDNGKLEYKSLVVEAQEYPKRTIIIENNT